MRTLDTAAVLALAPKSVQRIASRGNAEYTFTTTHNVDWVDSRKATAAERKAHGSEWTVRTAEQVAAERLTLLSADRGTFPARTFPKPCVPIGAWVRITRDAVATDGDVVPVGDVGQVWCEGGQSRTVWVAMGGTRWVQVGTESLEVLGASESTADALWDEPAQVDAADVTANAVALAERAEASGRDGVEFVRTAMGDAAADAVTAARTAHAELEPPARCERCSAPVIRVVCTTGTDHADTAWSGRGWRIGAPHRCAADAVTAARTAPSVHADPLGPERIDSRLRLPSWAQHAEPAERVIVTTVCTECGTDVDAMGSDASGDTACPRASNGTQHLPACDGPDALPVGADARWPGIDAVLTVEAHAMVRGVGATRVSHAPTNVVTWTRTDALEPVAHHQDPQAFADAVHAMRRTYRRLQAWRRACAMV